MKKCRHLTRLYNLLLVGKEEYLYFYYTCTIPFSCGIWCRRDEMRMRTCQIIYETSAIVMRLYLIKSKSGLYMIIIILLITQKECKQRGACQDLRHNLC